MHFVAPTEIDTANQMLEKRLWDAADQFRAISGQKAGQYSTPVLGLIFLRFAEAQFALHRKQLEKSKASFNLCTAAGHCLTIQACPTGAFRLYSPGLTPDNSYPGNIHQKSVGGSAR